MAKMLEFDEEARRALERGVNRLADGVKHGWLKDKVYAEAARKGWLGLNKLFIDKDGRVDKVCVGTGQTNNIQFYLTRPTEKGNAHGQAPVLWCVNELLRK